MENMIIELGKALSIEVYEPPEIFLEAELANQATDNGCVLGAKVGLCNNGCYSCPPK